MPKVVLDCAGVASIVSEFIAAGMAQHVRMNLEREAGLDAQPCARLGLPAIYPFRFYCKSGGLISYGFDQMDTVRDAASYVDRILRGANPGELPVQLPTKFQLVVNLKTAKTLGLTIPESFLLFADEVIE